MYDIVLVNGNVYYEGSFQKTNVYVEAGKIALVSIDLYPAKEVIDCENNLVIPGIIDPHTHLKLSLPNITSRDDFSQGTISAAYGGVTTIIDFLEPVKNESDLVKAFNTRLADASPSLIDYAFHACVMNPKGQVKGITKKMLELGMNTVKLFTTYSDSGRRTYDNEIKELLELSKKHQFTVLAHIENDDLITLSDEYIYRDLPISRPTISETSEALKLARFAKETGGNLYMVHLSSGNTLAELKDKYSDVIHKNFVIESCPHYFAFDNSVLEKEDGNLYTMAPPLRSKTEVEQLHSLIDDVDTIGTDHCSFNKADKDHIKLRKMPLGIAGIENSFSIMYSLFGDKVIPKMTENVARYHRLFPKKGIIQINSDADLFVYQLKDREITHHHGMTDHEIYQGFKVKGEVIMTMSRGKFIYKNKKIIPHQGKYIKRGGAK